MSFRESISDVLWSRPKLLAQSNVKNLQLFLVGAFVTQNVWEIFLILKNLWCISDLSNLPPPEYEIPPSGPEMAKWNNECALARKKCRYHLFVEICEFIGNSSKLWTDYYPRIWARTGRISTALLPRALWFVTIDYTVTGILRFFVKLSAAAFAAANSGDAEFSVQDEIDSVTTPREEKFDSANDFRDMLSAVVIEEMFSMTGIAWIMMLNQLLEIFFYRKFEFESDSYIQIAKVDLPGCSEIIDQASQMHFFRRDLLVEMKDDAPPKATHYNFISSDLIVISKSLLQHFPPNQSKSIVAHAFVHWKANYCYWDHLGAVVFLCIKILFNIEGEVHPAVIHALLYAIVFPVFDDVFYGLASWIHTRQVFNCDKSVDEAASSLVYLKQALVGLAVHRGSRKFDGWYSSWFFGEPSLLGRITRIRRRAS